MYEFNQKNYNVIRFEGQVGVALGMDLQWHCFFTEYKYSIAISSQLALSGSKCCLLSPCLLSYALLLFWLT